MNAINNQTLQLIFGDVTLGVSGEDFHYIFSYQTGGLESLSVAGKEWLYRTPKPTFWRATTDNDRGNGFSYKSGMWLGADLFIKCSNVVVAVDGKKVEKPIAPINNKYTDEEHAESVSLCFTYITNTVPAAEVEVTYTVQVDGTIEVKVHYYGKEGLPSLPVFGMRFIMPTKAVGYTYEGLSGETYPDRMAGGVPGTYHIEGLPVTPYMVPQDCNVHMATKKLTVTRATTLNNADADKTTFSLQFEALGEPFAFSCIPYTAEELENATHHEELPLPRRTVVSILGKVRGVGGIDSWGSDVMPQYQIDATQDISYAFSIKRVLI